MINTTSLNVVNNAKFSRDFVKPCYDTYCFSHYPATIAQLLTNTKQETQTLPPDTFGNLPTQYNKVIFFFIDAFGWNFYERNAEKYPLLKTFLTRGVVSKMTSQFPSTTAAHVTCMHTGLPVGQSGIYEWNYYEPLVDDVISPLLFSFAGDKTLRNTLKNQAISPTKFYPQQTFYAMLQAQGVNSHIFQHQAYTPSTYSDIVFRGATVHPYKNLIDALTQLAQLVTTTDTNPGYYFLYFDRIDSICHNYGPSSRQASDAIDAFFTVMEQFYRSIRNRAKHTLIMMSADHGQTPVDPQNTYYLNLQIPDLRRYLKTNQKGKPLVPAGSARDMFLHVKDEYIDVIIPRLQQLLHGKAEIYRTQELLAQQFFGLQEPSPTLLTRLGNVVILPYRNESVWWYEEGRFEMHFQGHHGGLTQEEMEIPLLVLPI